ncbi:hypothetical protein FFWV33_13640 [Flavobacterium faecale]|uniref:DUF2059 domain-containing protein n=1 Tax=Flavobacterium faecale TaxID=1355330 RepID=A0A2S1LFF8_9FLAO|nr:DUF2059 domain-containing protein [Flavobacterium faecale]AWG22495.1 hypothetical protein FFWV33_13640 [Flavobacterium faecale]
MKTSLYLLLLLCTCTLSFAQASPSKIAAIKELLDRTGSGKLGVQVGQAIIANFKKSQPNVPEGYWVEAAKEFNAENLLELLIPIYDENFTESEINGLIAFYKTTLGEKVIATLPNIMTQSMEVGRKWGTQMSFKIYQQLNAKKLIINE